MRVLISMLPELGHLFPTFPFARSLMHAGHEVIFGSIFDFEHEIRSRGFGFVAIHPETFPRGMRAQLDALPPIARHLANLRCDAQVCEDVLSGAIGETLCDIAPDFVLVDVVRPQMTFVSHGLGIPNARVSTSLSQHLDELPPLTSALPPDEPALLLELARRRAAVSHPLDRLFYIRQCDLLSARFGYPPADVSLATTGLPALTLHPEIVLCPSAFDFPRRGSREVLYVAPPADVARAEDVPPELATFVDGRRPLIFASLGSQGARYAGAPAFLEAFMAALGERPDLQGVVVTGELHATHPAVAAAPANVLPLRRAPQLWLLKRAAAFVTHAGLGSVREAIAARVPMIAIPQEFDQPGNAARVAYHGVGVTLAPRFVDARALGRRIDHVLREREAFRTKLSVLDEACKREEAENRGPSVIEALAARTPRARKSTPPRAESAPAPSASVSGWIFVDRDHALPNGVHLQAGASVSAPSDAEASKFRIHRSIGEALVHARGSTLARVSLSGDVTVTRRGAAGRELSCSWTLELAPALAQFVTSCAETYLLPERESAPEVADWCLAAIQDCRARADSGKVDLGEAMMAWFSAVTEAETISHRVFEIIGAAGGPEVFDAARTTRSAVIHDAARRAAGSGAGTEEGTARFVKAESETAARLEADLSSRVEALANKAGLTLSGSG